MLRSDPSRLLLPISARARSQRHQSGAPRLRAPDARERVPTIAGGAARSDHFQGHNNDSTLTRNKSLLFSAFLERFLDRIAFTVYVQRSATKRDRPVGRRVAQQPAYR